MNLSPEHIPEIISGIAATYKFPKFYLVEIENWFGPKWLGFAGKFLGIAGMRYRNFEGKATSKKGREGNVPVPPFVENRRNIQLLFELQDDGTYDANSIGEQVHHVGGTTGNLNRFANKLYPETAFFWYGLAGRGHPTKLPEASCKDRISLMGYVPYEKEMWTWYLDLHRQDGSWKVETLKNITADEIAAFRKQPSVLAKGVETFFLETIFKDLLETD